MGYRFWYKLRGIWRERYLVTMVPIHGPGTLVFPPPPLDAISLCRARSDDANPRISEPIRVVRQECRSPPQEVTTPCLEECTCSTAVLAVTLVAISACGDNPTGPDGVTPQFSRTSSNSAMVPFKAVWFQMPTDVPGDLVCPEGEVPGRAVADGRATHLGRYSGSVLTCFNPLGIWSKTDVTFSAKRDDDGLRMEMDDLNPFRVVAFDPATLAFEAAGGIVIVGGTGRFEGAVGYVNARSTGIAGVPGATLEYEGEVSAPHPRRDR